MYGKRPLWQWIVLYVIIGGVLYGLAYYFFFSKNGYSSNSYTPTTGYQAPTNQTAPTNSQPTTQTAPTPVPATPTPTPTPTPQPAAATPSHVTVSIANFAFNPATITIKKGDTITWTNSDSVPHTVTSDSGAFSSGNIAQGSSYSHTFNSTGTFAYHCSIHPSMHGTVVVTR